MKKTTVCTALLFMLAIMACNKKNDSPSKTEILTSGTWKITSMMEDADGNGSYETEFFTALPACYQDNYYIFKTSGQTELNEGASKCDPADPQIETGTWQFSQNETRLTIDGDEYIIDALTNTTLRVKDDVATFGMMVTFTKR